MRCPPSYCHCCRPAHRCRPNRPGDCWERGTVVPQAAVTQTAVTATTERQERDIPAPSPFHPRAAMGQTHTKHALQWRNEPSRRTTVRGEQLLSATPAPQLRSGHAPFPVAPSAQLLRRTALPRRRLGGSGRHVHRPRRSPALGHRDDSAVCSSQHGRVRHGSHRLRLGLRRNSGFDRRGDPRHHEYSS